MRKVFSILIILIFFFTFTSSVKGANGSLYLSPSSGVYEVGNTFSITITMNTGGTAVNAAQGFLSFPLDKLSVTGISKTGSIFSLWTDEPAYSNSSGTIVFGGGIPSPGYANSAGKIITITFKVKASGVASVNWKSGAILANDGEGTNILADMNGGSYTLKPIAVNPLAEPMAPSPKAPAKIDISSSTHPDENKWYSGSTVKFSWELARDITGVSILFDQEPASDPGPLSDGLFDTKTYTSISDGIWYLHLKLRNEYGWGTIEHFRVQIDTTPRPQITNCPKRLSLGDTLILEGTSLPDVLIRCYIQKEDHKPIIGETWTDENGGWIYIHNESLGRGLYKVYAVTVDEEGEEGRPGPEVVVAVTLPAFLRVAGIVIDYISVIIVLLVLVGAMVLGFCWGWYKFKSLRKRLRKETREVENTLHKALESFKQEISKQLKKLERVKGKRKLTKKEEEIEEQFKKDLDIIEKHVKKEIKDVEKELIKEESKE